MNTDKERQKWDHYYASLSSSDDDENITRFREEFTGMIAALLPEGGRILEAGCGAGEQSLALAKTNLYDVTLLDFSTEAFERARQNFSKENISAEFILEDASHLGKPEYDLVFNAGVLEHYSFDQQVSLLRGMASRSKKYVLALVPNFQNYWYWLWRIQKSSQGLWPFGKEIPSMGMTEAFKAAGLNYLGSTCAGSSWTESFITGLEGISLDLCELLLKVHRSGMLPEAQTSYLIAVLGSVDDISAPSGWGDATQTLGSDVETITAALADALALQVSTQREIESLKAEFLTKLTALSTQVQHIEQTNTVDLIHRVEEIERERAAAIDERVQAIEKRHEERLAEKIQEIERESAAALQSKLQEIEGVNAAALAERIREFEQRSDIDHAGIIRQIEHDHTGVLIGKIQEIEHLRAQIEALRPPPTLNYSQRVKVYLIRVFTKLGLIPQAIQLKKILKKIRHLFRKQVDSEISYQAPLSLGHPAVLPEKRVVILTYTFFDFDGNNMFCGGAERYVIELARLIWEQGYCPEVYQCGNGYWVRYYQDLRVTGIDVGGEAGRLAAEFQKLDHAEVLTIFSPFSLAALSEDSGSVGISHGVFWDYAGIQADPTAMRAIVDACQNLDTIISVDTNTINWMRASAAEVVDKFVYIPNFVDTDAFDVNLDRSDEKIVVLYPRRLYRPRGFWLVAEVLPEVLDRYPQVEFHLVGRADKEEAEYVRELISRYPGRVRWDTLSPEDMPQAYWQAHITVIPTIHSEGTSLSCLEALASGNAVIATNVGGLPNLILHNHNGLLIDVLAESLKGALQELIENPSLRQQLAERGREVATSFSINRWRSQWQEILSQYLDAEDGIEHRHSKVAFFPIAPGISWEGIKQRPHHLAMQLAEAGIETFWGNPTRRIPSPHPLVHILGPKDEISFHRPVVIIYYPFAYTTLDQYDDPFIVYDVLDDISIHETFDDTLSEGGRAVDYHQCLLEEADLVITSSTVLYHRLKPQRSDVMLIPNGVDLGHFKPEIFEPTKGTLGPDEKPKIGFHGAIADWFDVEFLREVARLRPDYQFILVGPISIDIQRLTRLPNVTYQGAVDYKEIPRHVARFDVGILPFCLNTLTHAVRPLKVLEYLAMGKPVVAVPLEEITGWPGVYLADTPQGFTEKLDQTLASKESILSDQQIQEFVASASWEKTARPLIDILLGRANESS